VRPHNDTNDNADLFGDRNRFVCNALISVANPLIRVNDLAWRPQCNQKQEVTDVTMDVQTGVLPPVEEIEFGKHFGPNLVLAEYRRGKWSDLRIEPLRAIELHPAAVVLHYAQAVFEGLKAYRYPDGQVVLFRPELNARRFSASAQRLLLPEIEEHVFLRAITDAVTSNIAYVPPRPGSLYLRPTLIACEPGLSVHASDEALLFVLTSPAGSYFRQARDGDSTITVFVDESMARAARGGTGRVKTGGNYAVTLQSIDQAKKKGCVQVLYLDACGRRQIEEMGGMNIFFVSEGHLITPALGDTILPGVTRASVLEAAHTAGIPVEERAITIDEVVEGYNSGNITEAFACGTAATVVGIREFLLESGVSLHLADSPGPLTRRFFDYIHEIQYGLRPDPHGWVVPVNSKAQ
jgi:branched-chain amino acid aminotransferase